jgi:hypothetical protein
MRTIHKYKLDALHSMRGTQIVALPSAFLILHLDVQNGVPCLWVEVEDSTPRYNHTFTRYGTGWEIEGDEIHIGTYMDGPYVWHVYMGV